jgi:hypothetical protein
MRAASLPALAFAVSFALTGCGMGPATTAVPEQNLTLKGLVHGGNNPVSGAIIGLYRAGSTGYGSAATNILTQTVTTDANGFFGLTGKYTCTAATDQMYITATQGNPGLGTSANNPALAMVAALGNCGNLNSNTYITINEITTVAAAWSLAQFSTDFAHIGTSSTNSLGLQNAFLDSQLIASTATGQLPVLLSTQATETGKILALADALAPCINSLGTGPCTSLFTAATPPAGSAPTDTFTAALNIVKNPSNNVAAVFSSISSQPPFPTTLTAAPNDWTLSLTVSGGGLVAPTALGIDQLGNVWVAGYYGELSAFTAQGVPFSGSGFGLGGYLSEVYGLAIDTVGNIWMTDEEIPSHGNTKGCLMHFQGAVTPSGVALGNYISNPYDNSINYPESVFADTNGYIDVANYAGGSATIYNSLGTLGSNGTFGGSFVISGLGTGAAAFPVSIIPDTAHGVWMANQESATIAHDTITGGNATAVNCCGGPNSVATDKAGNVWVTDYWSSAISQVSPASAVLINQSSVAGINSPSALAVDGKQNIWVANYHGASISAVAGAFNTLPAGTNISPNADSSNNLPGGYGLDANLIEPFSLAPDNSGNLWVANHANDNVVMFFGLAAPTNTPVSPVPKMP